MNEHSIDVEFLLLRTSVSAFSLRVSRSNRGRVLDFSDPPVRGQRSLAGDFVAAPLQSLGRIA